MSTTAKIALAHERQMRKLLKTIDDQDWAEFASMLSVDSQYLAPGMLELQGRERILTYYSRDRAIKSGCHRIENVFTRDDEAVSTGTFEAIHTLGHRVRLRFSDWVRFESGLIVNRRVCVNQA